MGKNLVNFLFKSKFDAKEALKNYKFYDEILDSGLFDDKFYTETYGIERDGLTHYLFEGFKKGNIPGPDFDPDIYLETYGLDMNPLLHFIAHGKDEGKGFVKSFPFRRKEEISQTNLAFLSNYEFDREPLVSIIVLNRNGLNHLKRLFKDFDRKANYSNYEIILVDNDSSDGSIDYVKSLDLPVKIIENGENVSFSKGNNQGAKIANGEYLLLLNNDIEPTYGWLNEMVGTMVFNENVGAVGAKLVFPFYPNDKEKSFSLQHSGDIFAERMDPCCVYAVNKSHDNLNLFDESLTQNKVTIAVTGAVVLIDKDIYWELGGLDENYVYGLEDVDFCLKLYKNNYKSVFSGNALLFHHESSTRIKSKDYVENDRHNYEVFTKKWGKFLSKHLLIDKIDDNKFFTEKNLKITIVNKENNEFISDMAKDFNNRDYTIELITNHENKYVGNSSDIILSFWPDYDLTNIRARKDIVKVFIAKGCKDLSNLNQYDIVVVDSKDKLNKLKGNVDNVFLIEDDFSKEFLDKLKNLLVESDGFL